jgi:hypothetical protein
MLYRMQEGTLALGNPCEDRTVNVLVLRDLPVEGVNLVVSRDRLPPDSTLRDHVARQLQQFQKELPAFTLLHQAPGTIDGRPAWLLELTWRTQGKPAWQLVATIDNVGALLTFTATVPGPGGNDALRGALLATIGSFKFGETGAGRAEA